MNTLLRLVVELFDYLARKLSPPPLSIEFRPLDPHYASPSVTRDFHTGEITAKSHYFRLRVSNNRGATIEGTEVWVVKLERWNDSQFAAEPGFQPFRLSWSSRINKDPGLRIPGLSHRFCDLGFVVEPGKTVRGRASDDRGRPIFWFDTEEYPSGGIDGLLPGRYRLTFGAEGKGTKQTRAILELEWIGGWAEQTDRVVADYLVCSLSAP